MNKKFFLHDNWKFRHDKNSQSVEGKEIGENEWFGASVPGTIHTDLLNNKLIPEPFFGDNELRLQWIGETGWQYKSEFKLPKGLDAAKPVELIFDGIDTVADIYLNGEIIGSSDNMFARYSFNVTGLLKEKNEIVLNFLSPVKYAKDLEKKHGKLPVALSSERVYIRKAQYSFGWDWGPKFVTSGIWKSVYLRQIPEIAIKSFSFDTISIGNDSAKVKVGVKLSRPLKKGDKVLVKIYSGKSSATVEYKTPGKKSPSIGITISSPKLWWPNGSGRQNLYKLQIIILREGRILDELNKKVGIRTVKLQQKEKGKNTFRFVVNGKPVFAKGANWIPADTFLPRADYERYKNLLTLAKNANMNIIRDWGGGIYEKDYFYELCDELGLMVWQDFMFACASYPEYEDFAENVKEEVTQNVERLQYHPSIAIWCGNNENEWIWQNENKSSYEEMPGYKIYHDLIPGLVKSLDPLRQYWPSSPFGVDDDPNSESSGNRHQWNIWSFWTDYREVQNDKSLFVTEFGFQSSANPDTIKEVLPREHRRAQSKLFEFHNKQVEGPERLFKFMSGHLPVRTELDNFIYLTQLNQGLALKECVEHWQYRYPSTNGSIIWQLNDCWPVSSWALVDSSTRPKLSYYMVKESFAPFLLKFIREEGHLEIKCKNNSGLPFRGYMEILYVDLLEGKTKSIIKKKINLKTEISEEAIDITVPDEVDKDRALLLASIYDSKNDLKKRSAYCSTEWKYLKLPKAGLKMKRLTGKDKNKLRISSEKPAFFVNLYHPDILFDENGFIILPGEKMETGFSQLQNKGRKEIKAVCLNDFLN